VVSFFHAVCDVWLEELVLVADLACVTVPVSRISAAKDTSLPERSATKQHLLRSSIIYVSGAMKRAAALAPVLSLRRHSNKPVRRVMCNPRINNFSLCSEISFREML
jgi:hypothetical protein